MGLRKIGMAPEKWETVKAANRRETEMAKVLVAGKKMLFHHWGPNEKASAELCQAWYEADLIFCCYPEALPQWVRRKHCAPLREGYLGMQPFLDTGTGIVILEWYD